jgi:PST family polysaccharide transporter
MGASAARGGVITVLGQVARIGIQLASVVVLSRLLSPDDYGVTVMVMAVIGIGEVFRDFGLANAAIQARELSKAQRDNLFWTNTGIGAGISIIVLAIAPLLSLLYGDSRLTAVAMALAPVFLLNGLSTQYRASLARNLRFGSLAVTDVAASALALGIAIALATSGAGYWALVAQQLGTPAVALVLLITQSRWVPGWLQKRVSIRPFLRYGWNILVAQLLTYAGRNADSFIIGIRSGATDLGLYDRAFQILMMPLNQLSTPISRVAVPVLSRLQDEEARFTAFLLRGQTIFLTILIPFFLVAAALAQPLVPVVLGDQWSASASLFQILAVAGVARAAGNATYWVALSRGLTGLSMRLALISTPLLIAAIGVGAVWGVTGVAVGVAATSVVMWPVGLLWYGMKSTTPSWAIFWNGARAIAGYLPGSVAAWVTCELVPFDQAVAQICAGLAAFLIVSGITALLWPAFRNDLRDVIEVRKFLKGRRAN